MFFLEDDEIGLRTLTQTDIENGYGDWLNDPDVCKYNSHHKFPMTEQNLLDYVDNISKSNSLIVFAVEEKKSHTHIGNVSLQQIDLLNKQAEIAFLFGEKKYWNKGYATKAAKLIMEHAFNELGINRIYFGTAENNIGMQKVGEKLGFKRIGIRREAIYKNGQYWNIYEYDILRKEWVGNGEASH